MTVRENVQLALLVARPPRARLLARRRARSSARGRRAARERRHGGAGRRALSVLAYGDVKRVELAIALANAPRLLLMDEPTAGMAPRERNELMALARRLAREQSIGVLFTEHNMDVVFAHADRDHRAGARRADRRRPAGGGARRRARARGLFRRRHDDGTASDGLTRRVAHMGAGAARAIASSSAFARTRSALSNPSPKRAMDRFDHVQRARAICPVLGPQPRQARRRAQLERARALARAPAPAPPEASPRPRDAAVAPVAASVDLALEAQASAAYERVAVAGDKLRRFARAARASASRPAASSASASRQSR